MSGTGYYEKMHQENTMAFLAIVYSFLGVKAEEERNNGGEKKPTVDLTLGRELTEEEVQKLPEDIREVIIQAKKEKIGVRCFIAEPKK